MTVATATIPSPSPRATVVIAGLVLAGAVLAVCWSVGEGARGLAYVLLFAAATVPGWPLAVALFSRRHAATWIAAGLLGYGVTALALWIAIAAGAATRTGFLATWGAAVALSWLSVRRIRSPLVFLAPWSRRDTVALMAILLVVPLLVWRPFARIGEKDPVGNEQYRAYFTADFLWHVALTTELSRFEMPPRNPYQANRTLHYYWPYFLLPAAAPQIAEGLPRETAARLKVNAAAAGLLFVGAIAVLAWTCVPRAVPVALAVLLSMTAGGAEGVYALYETHRTGETLEWLRNINIDALAPWFFGSLRIDGLPRSLWYTPQHAMSCALGAIAVAVAAGGGSRAPLGAIGIAGTALALALTLSPFPAGAFALIYGLVVVWDALGRRPLALAHILRHALAIVPMLLALLWCIGNATFEGAGDALRFGLSSMARATTPRVLLIKLGPVVIPALAALVVARRDPGIRAGVAALAVGLVLLYFVWLSTEPVWVGWRAGQILFVTLPVLVAAFFARLYERRAALATAAALVCFAAGLPTTAIDWYNAQHVESRDMGPGFRWTVLIPPGERAALDWLRRATPRDAVVQMEPVARGREAWTTVPSFGERRMAAGLPISLLNTPEYLERSQQVARMFAGSDAGEAAEIARRLGIQYVYAGPVEKHHYPAGIAKFDGHPERFAPVFRNDDVIIYAVH